MPMKEYYSRFDNLRTYCQDEKVLVSQDEVEIDGVVHVRKRYEPKIIPIQFHRGYFRTDNEIMQRHLDGMIAEGNKNNGFISAKEWRGRVTLLRALPSMYGTRYSDGVPASLLLATNNDPADYPAVARPPKRDRWVISIPFFGWVIRWSHA